MGTGQICTKNFLREGSLLHESTKQNIKIKKKTRKKIKILKLKLKEKLKRREFT